MGSSRRLLTRDSADVVNLGAELVQTGAERGDSWPRRHYRRRALVAQLVRGIGSVSGLAHHNCRDPQQPHHEGDLHRHVHHDDVGTRLVNPSGDLRHPRRETVLTQRCPVQCSPGIRVSPRGMVLFVVAGQVQPGLPSQVRADRHDLVSSLSKGPGHDAGTGAVTCSDVVHVVADHHVATASW